MGLVFLMAIHLIMCIEIVNADLFDAKFKKIFWDHRSTNIYVSDNVATLYECAASCTRDSSCIGFNYQNTSGTCQLVNELLSLYITSSDAEFSVWKKIKAGSNQGHNFVKVGAYHIAVSDVKLYWGDAGLACEPFGRLIMLDTVEKFFAISEYLKRLKLVRSDVEEVWTDGHYDSSDSTWKLADGRLLPTHDPSLMSSDESYPTCARLRYHWSDRYRWADCSCNRNYTYMCENIQ